MLSLTPGVRLFVATAPTDVRKSFNGLSDLVVGSLGMDPMAGDIFIFLNRRGDQMRMLFWDTDGYCILAKRLEAGTFRRVTGPAGESRVEIDAADLAMLLAGVDAKVVSRRRRYRHPRLAA